MFFKYRIQEYLVFLYRLFLVYLFYFVAKVLFTLYNYKLLGSPDIIEFFRLVYYGLIFDTAAIFYVNLLFIVVSIVPFFYNTTKKNQFYLSIIYFLFNGIAYATNFVDFIYFKYNLSRSASNSLETIQHEPNKAELLSGFLIHYWHVFVLYGFILGVWIYLYRLVRVKENFPLNKFFYYTYSTGIFLIVALLIVGGIRGGDFQKATRPINLVDANRHVKKNIQASIVLNTPFSIIRTLKTNSVQKVNYMSKDSLKKYVKNHRYYSKNQDVKPNIVLFIIESFGREYLGSFNKNSTIKNYKSYTPFIDSLANHSLIFSNAYANGYKSIHAMSSILAGIPSFKDAFTSIPYSNQKIQSLVSILKQEGYKTSFYHGAQNGSMGFLGFGNILGIDNYVGRTEYNNDADYDGYWGIWDEPFLQFWEKSLSKEQQPFFSTVFTVSSHEPFNIPEKYKSIFPEGDIKIHKCVRYTDYAIKKFFQSAKKEPWFNNTIFVMVADHSNLIYYDEYRKELNMNTVPILFYSPDEKYKGEITELAQQIDIYPTLLDMIGYNKPFRSWGRSLINDKEEPFVVKYASGVYYYFFKGFVLAFNGEKTIGFYKQNDKAMEHNLLALQNPIINEMEKRCKAFIQDYSDKIINYKLAN
jgi:phosphoglycerol transferase MdoB-like AlkP superfamily enzyme